jgi:nucleoside-diphosphate-sugar epimerase
LTIALNTTSTLELVKKVRTGGKFLFISSSEVYSGLKTSPFIEDQIGTTNTNHIRSAYIEGKRTGEAIVSTAKRLNNIDAKSVRLSLAYGPGTKPGDSRAINTFINQAITSSQIVLKDDGHAMRTYCYITDAIEMCLNVLDKGANDIYNVAGNSRVSILDLAKLIAELTNVKVNLPENSNNSLKGAPEDVWLDLKSTLSLSNKSEFVSLRIGVQNTIKWQKDNLLIV